MNKRNIKPRKNSIKSFAAKIKNNKFLLGAVIIIVLITTLLNRPYLKQLNKDNLASQKNSVYQNLTPAVTNSTTSPVEKPKIIATPSPTSPFSLVFIDALTENAKEISTIDARYVFIKPLYDISKLRPTKWRITNCDSNDFSTCQANLDKASQIIYVGRKDWLLSDGTGTKYVVAQVELDGKWSEPFGNSIVSTATTIPTTLKAYFAPDGSQLRVSFWWNGVPNPTSKDWAGVYHKGGQDNEPIGGKTYLSSCSHRVDESRPKERLGSCTIYVALENHSPYEVRLFMNDSYQRLATSDPFIVNY